MEIHSTEGGGQYGNDPAEGQIRKHCDHLTDDDLVARIRAMSRSIPIDWNYVIWLYLDEGYGTRKIAQMVGCDRSIIRNIIKRYSDALGIKLTRKMELPHGKNAELSRLKKRISDTTNLYWQQNR